MHRLNPKENRVLFATLFATCALGVIFLPSPTRNYIPVIWMFVGFAYYGYLAWSFSLRFGGYLVKNHKKEMSDLKIEFYDSLPPYRGPAGMEIFFKRKELSSISPIVKNGVDLLITYIQLTMIAFFGTIPLALLLIIKF